MAELAVEVYRDDVDSLTEKLLVAIGNDVGTLPYVDRAIIVAAALANVACMIDAVESSYTASCAIRLQRIAASWRAP